MNRLSTGLSWLAVLSGTSWAQVTQRVSVTSGGVPADAWSSYPSISADGRYVAFESLATNLVAGDTNGRADVFVRDRRTGVTRCVSNGLGGTPGHGESVQPSISADGRCVAFMSSARNLVPGDTNGKSDVFVHDLQSGVTVRASVDASGTEGNGDTGFPQSGGHAVSLSADGRYVAFASHATNLVPGDTNLRADIFVHDLQSGTTEVVSVGPAGVLSNDDSEVPTISADGRFVAFVSLATNLVPFDGAPRDVFVRDRLSGTTELASVDANGASGDNDSFWPSISADGRYVAFTSAATNLVPGDSNDTHDVFVRDRQAGTTRRMSQNASGVEGNSWSGSPSISSDGRWVAFFSGARNLAPGDSNDLADVYVHDRQSGTNERVSVASRGTQGNLDSYAPSISADGRYVAFESFATNLVPEDTFAAGADVFVHDRIGGTSFTSLCQPGIVGVIGCPCANPPGGAGRGCDNSAATGGATMSASGGTYLSSDSLVFETSGETPTATSLLLQANAVIATGAVYGQGVRCAGGALKRLYMRTASGGSIRVPSFALGDASVSGRSAALGDPIQAGQSRWYFVYYRDPIVLGGCPASSTFNATQSGAVVWSP